MLRLLQTMAKGGLWPDHLVFWSLTAAIRDLDRIPWVPDVVVATVGPTSVLVTGRRASKRFQVPLVVDYRDLLVDWRTPGRGLFHRLEHSLRKAFEFNHVAEASMITAVTQPMVEQLSERYKGIPVQKIANGYEPRDFVDTIYEPFEADLILLYAGTIYPGKQDPTPILEAVRQLRDSSPELKIFFHFYGAYAPEVQAVVERLDLTNVVEYRGLVPHREAVSLQASADILVLLIWDHPNEKGDMTGKLMEYLGARRPILCVGLEDGVGPDLIRDNNLGLVSKNRETIAEFLRDKAQEKRKTGGVLFSGDGDFSEYTREYQSTAMLKAILNRVGTNEGQLPGHESEHRLRDDY